jgi:phage baseplate assembly protein W
MANFLGTGLKFPLQIDSSGKAILVSEQDLVKQSIIDILTTPIGTRPFESNYGSKLFLLRYEPNSTILQSLANTYIYEVFQQEKRATFKMCKVTNTNNELFVYVEYQITKSGVIDSLGIPINF